MSDLNLDGLTDAQLRLFAVRRARRVQHLMTDPRSLAVMDVAERYGKGEATDAELEKVRDEAWDAACGGVVAAAAAWATALAAAKVAAKVAAKAAERAEQQKILDEVRAMK